MGAALKLRVWRRPQGTRGGGCGWRWSDRLHDVKSGKTKEVEVGIERLSSPRLDHAAGWHRHRHAQSLNFLPTRRYVMIDGTHWLSGLDGGVAPPPPSKHTHTHTPQPCLVNL